MKYLLTIPDEVHKEIKDKAWKSKKSMNQYILDCVQLVTLQNNLAEKMDKDYMKDRPIPTLRYGDVKEQPTPSKIHKCSRDCKEHVCQECHLIECECKKSPKKAKKPKCSCFAADKGVHNKDCPKK